MFLPIKTMSIDHHVDAIVDRFQHFRGSSQRADLLTILVEICRLEFDPQLSAKEREALEMTVWQQCCDKLGIEQCLCAEIGKVLVKCSECCDKSGGCFGCFA